MSENHLELYQEIKMSELKGMDWDNNDLFFTHSFEEETSQFDPKGRWVPGGEYYERTFYCRVPKAFQNCEEMIDVFVVTMMENYPDAKGFWKDAKDSPV